MRKKTRYGNASQKTGRGIASRKNKSKSRRPRATGARSGANSETVVASSILTLRLKSKGACEVSSMYGENSMRTHGDFSDDPRQRFKQLKISLNTFLRILKKDLCTVEWTGSGIDTDELIDWFKKKALPEGFYWNIDNDNVNGYFFTLYKESNNWDYCWHTIEIKHIVKDLLTTNKALHDLFVLWIANFGRKTGVETWFEDVMSYCQDWLIERTEEMEAQLPDKADDKSEDAIHYNMMMNTLADYRCGNAARYRKLITKAPSRSGDQILKELTKLKTKHPIAGVIAAGCRLMSEKYNIWQFCYCQDEDNDEYNSPALRFENQSNILWDSEDVFSEGQIEMNDANAQEGVHPPVISVALLPSIKKFDADWLNKGLKWIEALGDYIINTSKILEKYEPKNSRTKHKV